jgi:malonate transporter and related proteins
MLHVVLLILPVFALIVAGYWARHSGFLDDGFWAPAEKLGYWVLLPSLIIHGLATNELPDDGAGFGIAIAITVLSISFVMLAARRIFNLEPRGFASVHQGSLRLNGLLAIASCIALLGPQTLPLLGILMAVWIPFSNSLSVYGFVAHKGGEGAGPVKLAVAVVKNPMVFAVIIGGGLNALGLGPFMKQFFLFDLLGRAALPVGLLAVGAALDLSSLRRPGPRVSSALAIKLLVMPALMLWLCHMLETTALVTAVALICASMPASPSSYLLAKQLDGDHALMATIITAQTLVGVVTVTLWASYGVSLVSP